MSLLAAVASNLLSDSYPPSAFYFKVVLSSTLGLSDTSFKEVSGLTSKMDPEQIHEGGENRYKLQLPTVTTHSNLVMKRGIANRISPLVLWCKKVLEGDLSNPIEPMPVLVFLMNEKRLPARVWGITDAYPVKWDVEGFNSTKNDVAIETIEMAYNTCNRMI